jgi:hypothetical protein
MSRASQETENASRGVKQALFLNVDLEIESHSSLDALEQELGDRVFVLYSGRIKRRHCLFLELARTYRGPDKIIHAFCALIEQLSPAARRLWNRARRRTFDIGYEARLGAALGNQFNLRPDTVQRVAHIGANLAVSFYREDKTNAGDAGHPA